MLNTSMHPEVTVEQSPSTTLFKCPVESWNQVDSDTVPNENLHLEWIQNNISRRDNILESQIRLLSSFVYPNHISIITNSQRSYGQKVYCRYYNCLREEISNSSYQSIFFPMNVIRCPRRIGVKYMSISFDLEEISQETIPLVYRVFEAPIHEVSVCVGPIYGSESKWLEVAEFIEHYKLIGECHQRSKHHSKWVINVDIDERLVILDDKIKSVGSLLNGYNDTVAGVGFAIRRIQKTEKLPEKYESDEQIISEMEFLKYNVSSPVTWGAYKTIYRPEKIAAMYYHWAYQRYPDTVAEYVKAKLRCSDFFDVSDATTSLKSLRDSAQILEDVGSSDEESEWDENSKKEFCDNEKSYYTVYGGTKEIGWVRNGSSHEWKVSIIPRGQNNKPTGVNSIPPFTIDGKADERFNKFYRTIDRLEVSFIFPPVSSGGEMILKYISPIEPPVQAEPLGNTKDLSVESSAVVIVPRTTVAPGVTNKVSVITFRPLHFTAPPKNGPPGVSPPPTPGGQCGVAPDFTPCVSNEIASKSLLECCKRKNLPAGCQQLCRYDITQAEIRAAMDRGQCGIFNVAPFLECASQGKDNSECCRHRGIVQKTGPQCEQFCRPTQGLSALGVQHIVCGNAVGDMLHCHHSGVRI
ncbi:hypothetical protein GCK72_012897 [Caenorhabditis remanei]|uniref:Glycosyltransferase family 92 protein n=1 Tax=Caenorhabditis remanei TaxID=31234 RepID=A0A6A5GP79_CAERE|nr:hypothetical protein GCK72_012897 [Caenorhabditis remanei]KAF1756444.1 hypothetical protein GCK72_012897 [Caenorhabditis remanei]